MRDYNYYRFNLTTYLLFFSTIRALVSVFLINLPLRPPFLLQRNPLNREVDSRGGCSISVPLPIRVKLWGSLLEQRIVIS